MATKLCLVNNNGSILYKRVSINMKLSIDHKEDWVLLTERLQSNGIRIEAGPVNRFGANGVGTSIYFRDPDGNQIEARYYSKEDAADSCLLGS